MKKAWLQNASQHTARYLFPAAKRCIYTIKDLFCNLSKGVKRKGNNLAYRLNRIINEITDTDKKL